MAPDGRLDDGGEGLESETSQEYPGSEEDYSRAKSIYHHGPQSDADTLESTRSLFATDYNYIYIADRRYCEDYFLPNDEREQSRWQMMHQIYVDLFQQQLTTVPLQNPRRILDIGAGTGEWATDMAVLYPEAEVVGTDIAPIQPTSVPQNVFWEFDNAEGVWNWTTLFDFIHLRNMNGAFKDWNHIYSEAYKNLQPGGWIEVLDWDDHQALLNFFKNEQTFTDLFLPCGRAISQSPRAYSADHLKPENITKLGFVDVSNEERDLPMGSWGDDYYMRINSKVLLELQSGAIDSFVLRPLVDWGGWEVDAVLEACEKFKAVVRRLCKNPKTAIGCKFRVRVLRGRKPFEGEVVNGNNGLLSPGETDTDAVSVVTVTKDDVNGGGATIT